MDRFNKKAFSEITSFALITMLIVVSSIVAYTFSTSLLDDNINEMDLINMKNSFKILNYKFSEITQFDDSSFSINLNFNKGLLSFNSNQMYYTSLVDYNGATFCENGVCSSGATGSEIVSLNLTSPYVFYENFTLNPGSYVILFKNVKNESKIRVVFK